MYEIIQNFELNCFNTQNVIWRSPAVQHSLHVITVDFAGHYQDWLVPLHGALRGLILVVKCTEHIQNCLKITWPIRILPKWKALLLQLAAL